MSELWRKIQESRGTSDIIPFDFLLHRREEIVGELPTPFCCPMAAGAGYLLPVEEQGQLIWMLTNPTDYRHIRDVKDCHRIRAYHCPFCGESLPGGKLKLDAPHFVQQPIEHSQCNMCRHDLNQCLCSAPQSIWEADDAPEVWAVTALIRRGNRVLSVSRKNDHQALGLPGGKIEQGESCETAMCRELLEETGLVAHEYHLVFDAYDGHLRTRTYHVTKSSGELHTEEAGRVTWSSPIELSTSSPFKQYNEALFRRLGMFAGIHA